MKFKLLMCKRSNNARSMSSLFTLLQININTMIEEIKIAPAKIARTKEKLVNLYLLTVDTSKGLNYKSLSNASGVSSGHIKVLRDLNIFEYITLNGVPNATWVDIEPTDQLAHMVVAYQIQKDRKEREMRQKLIEKENPPVEEPVELPVEDKIEISIIIDGVQRSFLATEIN